MLKSGHLVELYDDLAGDGTATREEFVQIIFCWIPRGPLKVMKRYTAAVLGTHRGGRGGGWNTKQAFTGLPVSGPQNMKNYNSVK